MSAKGDRPGDLKNICLPPRCVHVRNEDLDWEIYQQLACGKARTPADFTAAGYEPDIVEASLSRLEEAMLIGRDGDAIRVLSFQESLLLCQLKHGEEDFVVENGVIRVRDGEGRKD